MAAHTAAACEGTWRRHAAAAARAAQGACCTAARCRGGAAAWFLLLLLRGAFREQGPAEEAIQGGEGCPARRGMCPEGAAGVRQLLKLCMGMPHPLRAAQQGARRHGGRRQCGSVRCRLRPQQQPSSYLATPLPGPPAPPPSRPRPVLPAPAAGSAPATCAASCSVARLALTMLTCCACCAG